MASLLETHRGIATRILFCPAEERTKRELQRLPRAEREQVWADMTGNQENVDYRMNAERPEFVQERLASLSQELSTLNHTPKSGYHRAVQQNPDYVDQERLKFLRADNFDTSAAAVRMMKHFQDKLELFGPDVLGRNILLSDLNADDLESLRAGGIQFLLAQDHATRGVIFTRNLNYQYKDRNNMVRLEKKRGALVSKYNMLRL
jgi:hypothetical protein